MPSPPPSRTPPGGGSSALGVPGTAPPCPRQLLGGVWEGYEGAHRALVRSQQAAIRSRLTPATWRGRIAPGLRELARLQREQPRVLDSFRVAMEERAGAAGPGAGADPPGAGRVRHPGRLPGVGVVDGRPRTAYSDPSGPPGSASEGGVSEDLLAARRVAPWSRDREDFYKVLSGIVARAGAPNCTPDDPAAERGRAGVTPALRVCASSGSGSWSRRRW